MKRVKAHTAIHSGIFSNPDDDVRTAVFICPDDIKGEALFQRFIIDEGGEASLSDLTYVQTVKPNDDAKPELPYYMPQNVTLPEKYSDTDQIEAQGATLEVDPKN